MDLESYTRTSLGKIGFHPRRQRGQSFLVDESILSLVVEQSKISPGDIVVEAGAGLGTLTRLIAARAKHVYTFEIEENLFPFLEAELAPFPNITIIRKSFNKYSFGELIEDLEAGLGGARVKVVTNLPYQITNLFIMTMVEYSQWISHVTVMLQKEVAERLSAAPGDRSYASLTVLVQNCYFVEIVADVPPSSFLPPPRVKSAIVSLTSRPESEAGDLYALPIFERMVTGIFRHRRKTLLNALSLSFPHIAAEALREAIVKAGLPPGIRPQELGRSELAALAREVDGATGDTANSACDNDIPKERRG